MALRSEGWTVTTERDGPKVYWLARNSAPAAVILDYRLERGGCLPVLREIASSSHTAHIPVIVLSPDTAAAINEFDMAGAHICLGLPVELSKICAAVRACVKTPSPPPALAPRHDIHASTRMAALKASGLLDSPVEEQYDRLTRLVGKLMSTPVALLSLVDKERQFFKSQVGLQEPWAAQRQTPLSHSFCQWVVSGREQVAIEDAQVHPVLKTNQAIRDLGVVAYLGVPVNSEGQTLGSLCAIDSKPRSWQGAQLDLLKELACLFEALIAQAMLVHKPPRHAVDFDHYVSATANAQNAALSILRRETRLEAVERELLFDQLTVYGHTLVQLNRLIQISQALDR